MVSVGWGRASRGLTAIPSIRRAGRNRGDRAAAQRSAGPPGTGFLLREERRLRRRGEKTWAPAVGGPNA